MPFCKDAGDQKSQPRNIWEAVFPVYWSAVFLVGLTPLQLPPNWDFLQSVFLKHYFLESDFSKTHQNEFLGRRWGRGFVGALLHLVQDDMSEFIGLGAHFDIILFFLHFSDYLVDRERKGKAKSVSKMAQSHKQGFLVGKMKISGSTQTFEELIFPLKTRESKPPVSNKGTQPLSTLKREAGMRTTVRATGRFFEI